jgi:hypothetical protein
MPRPPVVPIRQVIRAEGRLLEPHTLVPIVKSVLAEFVPNVQEAIEMVTAESAW